MSDRGRATVAAGGVVLDGQRVLLVRLTYSRQSGRYMLPGGYVDPGEMIDQAVEREVREEAGVHARVEGLIGLRARVEDGVSNTYCIFLLRYESGEPRADGRENDDVRWFTLADLEGPDGKSVVGLAHAACVATLRGDVQLIRTHPYLPETPGLDAARWRVFL